MLSRCSRLPARPVPLDEALGCVLAEPVMASEPVPPFANTAMDGYAVRAADTAGAPVRLRVVATLAAGVDPAGITVGEGEAVRIMTGAPIPAGADAIVMVERTRPDDGGAAVVIEVAAAKDDHLRLAGDDLRAGEEVFPAGTVLGPGALGVLASIGLTSVPAFPRARVAVLSTGDELVEGGGPLRPGQIRDSNRHALLALVREAGAEPVDLGIGRDDEQELEDLIRRGLGGSDALVTTGGVSMGEFDYVKAILHRLAEGGAEGEAGVSSMQVAIKPAKPLSFGVVAGKPVFGLPGNPVSSMVSFELFARPALRRMMGHERADRPRVRAVADDGLRRRPDGKLHLVRVVATVSDDDGRFHVRSSGGQASNQLLAMALANALALVPDGDGVEPGGEVTAMLLTAP